MSRPFRGLACAARLELGGTLGGIGAVRQEPSPATNAWWPVAAHGHFGRGAGRTRTAPSRGRWPRHTPLGGLRDWGCSQSGRSRAMRARLLTPGLRMHESERVTSREARAAKDGSAGCWRACPIMARSGIPECTVVPSTNQRWPSGLPRATSENLRARIVTSPAAPVPRWRLAEGA